MKYSLIKKKKKNHHHTHTWPQGPRPQERFVVEAESNSFGHLYLPELQLLLLV